MSTFRLNKIEDLDGNVFWEKGVTSPLQQYPTVNDLPESSEVNRLAAAVGTIFQKKIDG